MSCTAKRAPAGKAVVAFVNCFLGDPAKFAKLRGEDDMYSLFEKMASQTIGGGEIDRKHSSIEDNRVNPLRVWLSTHLIPTNTADRTHIHVHRILASYVEYVQVALNQTSYQACSTKAFTRQLEDLGYVLTVPKENQKDPYCWAKGLRCSSALRCTVGYRLLCNS